VAEQIAGLDGICFSKLPLGNSEFLGLWMKRRKLLAVRVAIIVSYYEK